MPDVWREEMERRADRWQALERYEDAQAVDHELCRRSFLHWVDCYGWVYNPQETENVERRMVPFTLWDSQKDLVLWLEERLAAGEEALVPKSRKIGVTWLVLHILWHRHRFERGFSALIGSRKEELVDRLGDMDSLFERLRFIERMQPPWLGHGPNYTDKQLLLADHEMETELAGESTQGGFGQGKRRTVVFIDEAGKIETGVMRLTWTAIESVAKSIWVVFNPAPLSSHYIEQVRRSISGHKVRAMDWTADPTRPEDFKARTIRPVGRLTEEEFAEQYECKSGAVMPGRIWPVSIPPLIYDEDEPGLAELRRRAPAYGGMDFGSSLTSRLVCLIGLLDKSDPWKLWIEWDLSWFQTSWKTAGSDIMEKLGAYPNVRDVFYDPAGENTESDGKSWVLNLGSAGVPFRDLQRLILPGEKPMALNTGRWISWSCRHVRMSLDSVQIKIHKRCRYLLKCIEGYHIPIPQGVDPIDAGASRTPAKDDASHGADALRHLYSGVRHVLFAERAAGRDTSGSVLDFADDEGLAHVEDW